MLACQMLKCPNLRLTKDSYSSVAVLGLTIEVKLCLKKEGRCAKSLYRSGAVWLFYGTANEIWAGLGLVGDTEKKLGADYEQLLRVVFSCFQGQKNHCIVHTKKLLKMKLKRYFFDFFYRLKILIVSCSNRDTSLRDLPIMTLVVCSCAERWFKVHLISWYAAFLASQPS